MHRRRGVPSPSSCVLRWIATPVCRDIAEARRELTQLRRAVIETAGRFVAPIAASTHPFSLASSQKRTDKERYVALLEEMQGAARRMMICGLHVHGIDDDELRIDLMNQLTYFLPHMLALSCSSPFWEGEQTGLMSFRMLVFNAVPRTGLPSPFRAGRYRRHTDTLIETGVIVDTSRIWWDLRPSARYPTRNACHGLLYDVGGRDQARGAQSVPRARPVPAAARHQRWRNYPLLLVGENRWRAMRYSFDAGLLDLGRQEIRPYAELLEELIELVRDDAQALGCLEEIEGLRRIRRAARARTGSSRCTSRRGAKAPPSRWRCAPSSTGSWPRRRAAEDPPCASHRCSAG